MIDRLTLNISAKRLFAVPPMISFEAESLICPVCKNHMKVLKTKTRELATLVIGDFIGREKKYSCCQCNFSRGSGLLASLVPKGAKFGYDVLVYVGKDFFLRCRNAKEIVNELGEKNISICKSEVSYLARKFVIYLALAHRQVEKKTRAFLAMHGGYILHLDGACEGGSPHLISALDGITEIVLDNVKIPTENSEQLIPFLRNIKKTYGDPVAVVSDMGSGITMAIEEVFKNIRHLLCHFHFLRALGKGFFGDENDTIRKRLRKYGIQEVLRRRVLSLKKLISCNPYLVDGFVIGFEHLCIPPSCPLEYIPTVATYTLILWALEGKSQGKGFGFPFDQAYLIFYQRLHKLASILRQLYEIKLQGNMRPPRIYGNILHVLVNVLNDPVLAEAALKMQQKVSVFNNLRVAMRITLPESKRGLNDNGDLSNIKTIEKEVKKFRDRLCKDKHLSADKDYQKLIGQLNKYWEKLFSDPIVVKTKAGSFIIQPQRTNNILEQFFRDLSRRYRKKSGLNSMEKTLKAMLADTPLVKNLENKEYLSILLGSKETLEERFAEIDAKEVREEIMKLRSESEGVSPKIKKLIKMAELPESIVSLLKHQCPDPQQPPGIDSVLNNMRTKGKSNPLKSIAPPLSA